MPAAVTLFLCGDVMTGRGIDQILPHPAAPRLHEAYARSALDYVELAECASGPLARAVDFTYVWGDALAELERRKPDVRIVNLETAVTRSDAAWPGKAVHYRMHPENVPCLESALIDCCVLANNHVLDWGRDGLTETLHTLHGAALRTAGAGATLDEACAPAIMAPARGGRVLVYGYATPSSGVPGDWAATRQRPGVAFLPDLSPRRVDEIARHVQNVSRTGDLVVFSIHWGSNWDYPVSREERTFAHALIDRGGVHIVHGHSSHHARGVEVYRSRPIMYGCGDFLNDYEGIRGYESYRPDLSLMYFPTMDSDSGTLLGFAAVPTRVHRFRVVRASDEDASALFGILHRESAKLDTCVEQQTDGSLVFRARD